MTAADRATARPVQWTAPARRRGNQRTQRIIQRVTDTRGDPVALVLLHYLRRQTAAGPKMRLPRGLLRRLAGHRVLDDADDRGQDRASHAAADRLADHRADIDIASRTLQHRQQRGEQRAAARTADRAGNGIAERAEIDVLHRRARGIATESTGDDLDN